MGILSGDPLTQLSFSLYENKGVFALLLGSGISRAADIPTGWEITLDLIRRVAKAQGVEDQPDWAAWYRELAGEEPNYSALLEELASSPGERRSILHSYIEPTPEEQEEGKKTPTEAHQAIAELVSDGYVRVIVTTNFDRLLENALREAGVEPTIIASADTLAGAEPFSHSSCYILKLHGDYKDARILNTEEELRGYPAEYDTLLDRLFDEHGLVVAGWSGEWDHALRTALLRAPNRRYPVYWAARGDLTDGAKEIISHRQARMVSIKDADSFLSGVLQRVKTLAQTHRQSPISTELLINSTKRYLGKAEYRIRLDELFEAETNRLLSALSEGDFSVQGGFSGEEFRSRVGKYEAFTEPLAKMAGVVGRWGGQTEDPMIIDVLRTIYAKCAEPGGGTVFWLNLRTYPVVLLFTAYGIGLTRASRWKALHDLLSEQITTESGSPTRVVDDLFLWAWQGADNQAWQNLKGFDRRKTALSDHLFELFSDWARSFVGVVPDFALLYERLEVLSSLVFLERVDLEELRESVATQDVHRHQWMPVGRTSWNRKTNVQLIAEIGDSKLTSKLIDAGFAKGSEEFLQLSIQNFQRISARIGW
ncbi:MAG TPA: SIR2 family protein [Woeseiaceae bacterium]|nr:SIR2 family protein [Woeseiaceae bacterium]